MPLLRPALPADENFSPFFALLSLEKEALSRAKLSVVCLMTQAKIMVSLLMEIGKHREYGDIMFGQNKIHN
jgi:hypothetical protein